MAEMMGSMRALKSFFFPVSVKSKLQRGGSVTL